MRRNGVQALEHDVHMPGHQIGDGLRATLVGHMHDIGPGHHLEQFATDLTRRAIARGGVHQLAGIFLGVVNQLQHIAYWQCGRHRQQHMSTCHQPQWLKIAQHVIGQLGHHVRADGQSTDRRESDRIAIGRRTRHVLQADHQRTARTVVDHHRLSQLPGQIGLQKTRQRIGGAARGLRHHHAHRFVGVAAGWAGLGLGLGLGLGQYRCCVSLQRQCAHHHAQHHCRPAAFRLHALSSSLSIPGAF